jgi:rhodanese-related sulfurtransferase
MSRKCGPGLFARSAAIRRLAGSRFRVAAGLLLLALWPSRPSAQTALTAIEATIAATYEEIGEISGSKLDSLLASADSSRLVLFDTRPVAEFEQSHIRKAIRVNPDASADAFFLAHDSLIRDKDVVLYCSVGYRSSILAVRLQQRALESGATSVANLRGGLFRWYNEGRPVFNSAGETDEIHPYDTWWGRLIDRREPATKVGEPQKGGS